MQTYIALLRGINISGQKPVRMAELKALFESLGFVQVETYVQSGNVVFDCASTEPAAAAAQIEAEIQRRLGFTVPVLLRRTDDFERILSQDPYPAADPAKRYVTFLYSPPSADLLAKLAVPAGCSDEFTVLGEEIHLHCPGGYGVSKLSNTFFENKLKVTATTRNWKTVTTLTGMGRARD